jgi:hypothetical protein
MTWPRDGRPNAVAVLCTGAILEPRTEHALDLGLVCLGKPPAKLLAIHLEAILAQRESGAELPCEEVASGSVVHAMNCTAYQEGTGLSASADSPNVVLTQDDLS